MISFVMNSQNKPYLIDKINRLDPTRLWVVDIRERKSKRTLDQNRRLWSMYNSLGKHLGLDADEVHQFMGYKFLRYQKDVGGKVEEFIKSTTKLNTAEMAEYQESIERYGANLGWIYDLQE